jgi:cytochrome c oxidase cbb3-type subunit III
MKPNPTPTPEDPIRPHVFDGIQEYDKRLPNWWLNTLYITIVFWVAYWAYHEWLHLGQSDVQIVESAMARIATERLSEAKLDDASLWQMSQNAAFRDAGKATFDTNCAACHLASLRGKSESAVAIGPDLTDTRWLHGGKPTEVHQLIMKGVLAKGMPAWESVLGAKKISEATAYILSKHQEGEPVIVEQPAGGSH